MANNDLGSIARGLAAEGKGILAADESFGTIEKRFKSIDLPSTEENRRAYRDMLFTTPGFGDFISGVIKGFVFGGIVGVVGCFRGLTVEGGTEGVGRATTQTVAITSVSVCLADFFITKLTL